MARILVRLKDKTDLNDLKNYGSIVYVSPILNLVGIESNKYDALSLLLKDKNVLSAHPEDEGTLLCSTV